MADTLSVQETARALREIPRTPDSIAHADQASCEWRDAFTALGLKLGDPGVSEGAFAAMQIVLWHLVDTDGDIREFGERLIEGSLVLARYVR